MLIDTWKQKAKQLKCEIHAVYLAMKSPRTPWYARVLAAIIVGYAFSPIDLIPDPIPILGYLDDLVLLPLGIVLLVKIIPSEVLLECRTKAAASAATKKPKNWVAGSIIIAIWVGLIIATIRYILSGNPIIVFAGFHCYHKVTFFCTDQHFRFHTKLTPSYPN